MPSFNFRAGQERLLKSSGCLRRHLRWASARCWQITHCRYRRLIHQKGRRNWDPSGNERLTCLAITGLHVVTPPCATSEVRGGVLFHTNLVNARKRGPVMAAARFSPLGWSRARAQPSALGLKFKRRDMALACPGSPAGAAAAS